MSDTKKDQAYLVAHKGVPLKGHNKQAVFALLISDNIMEIPPVKVNLHKGQKVQLSPCRVAGPSWAAVRRRLHQVVDGLMDKREEIK